MDLSSQDTPRSPSIVPTGEIPLTKEQKAFNNLIRKIEARRARLAEWNTAIPAFRQRFASEVLPLQQRLTEVQTRLALALDQAYGQKGLNKGEREKLSVMIMDLASEILSQEENEAIKALYNKYGHGDFDQEEADRQEGMKTLLEGMFGMDLGDDLDMESPEELLKRVEAQYRAQQEAREAKAASRKKSARQQAKEARQEAEKQEMSLSIREVYRKLASTLHPDRESDPVEKQRKTELMQRANEAYQKGNLLQLLELQLEQEQIDQARLAAMGADQLKRYMKILKEQLNDLEMEIRHLEDGLVATFNLPPFRRYEPRDLMSLVREAKADCEDDLRRLEEYLENAGDPKRLKAWLWTVRLERRADPRFDFPF